MKLDIAYNEFSELRELVQRRKYEMINKDHANPECFIDPHYTDGTMCQVISEPQIIERLINRFEGYEKELQRNMR